jgi:catechol 2,3-dioxygenase-like lactoylglutathione lyase family enzyme
MAIALDHTHVPSRDMDASARQFALIFGLVYNGPGSWMAGVRVNETFKIAFVNYQEPIDMHHYAFIVGEDDFDAILARIRQAGVPYRSDPEGEMNNEINAFNGGRGFYWLDPDGHLMEVLTQPDPAL